MYVRRDTQKPTSRAGKVKETTYVTIAHNVVEDSLKGNRARPVAFANPGPEGDFSRAIASSMARAFERYARQGRNTCDFLVSACEAAIKRMPAPKLFQAT